MSYVRRSIRFVSLLCFASAIAPQAGQAQQVRVGASVGFVRFQGGSEPADPTDTVFVEPYGPLDYRLRGSLSTADWRFALAVSFAKPGLGAAIDWALIMDRAALKVVTFEPTVGRRVLGSPGASSQLWLEAGPSIGLWIIYSDEARTEVGGVVAATLRQRIAERFESIIRGDVSISPSFLRDSDDVNDILRFTNVSRYGFSIGFDFRL